MPTVYSILLLECFHRCATFQGKDGGQDAKSIHTQESNKVAREKSCVEVEELRSMEPRDTAKKVVESIERTLTYCDFPGEHWTRICATNTIERLNRKIRRRTRVVGSFPYGNFALVLVCTQLRHVASIQ